LKERLVEVAIGAFQRPHEGAFLSPALPPFVLLLLGEFIGLVVADARSDLVIHACHGVRFPAGSISVHPLRHYGIAETGAMNAEGAGSWRGLRGGGFKTRPIAQSAHLEGGRVKNPAPTRS